MATCLLWSAKQLDFLYMVLFFKVLAVILVGVAAYFLWVGNNDGLFVTAVFASVSFFLSVRFEVKARNEQREAERELAENSSRGQSALAVGSQEIGINNELRTSNNEQLTTENRQPVKDETR